MGLLLEEGKVLKHLKEKAHHKVPYHDLSFCGEGPRSRRYRYTVNSWLLYKVIIIIILFLVTEHRWNEIYRGRMKYSGKTYPKVTLYTTNPTWFALGSNTGPRVGRWRLTV
jgi:hypothetical protein